MIISMHPHASKEQIERVCARVQEFGYKVHSLAGEERVSIVVTGSDDLRACMEAVEAMPGVATATEISSSYQFASREFRQQPTSVEINGTVIGGNEFVVMAGPCSVESEAQILETAEAVALAGAKILRGGAFKPRTSPYEFQGLAEAGLKLLDKARRATGLTIITEVLSERDVSLVAEYTDIVQVGARNMQNFALLKALGRCGRPVLLKRGMGATIKELLLSAEYIIAHGNEPVILCERGIRTFETATRNTCDIAAIPVLRELTHLPVVLDPSHAAGRASVVPALARAAVAVGADGLLIEVHPCPERALSDGAQSLTVPAFSRLMRDLEPYIRLWKEQRGTPVPVHA
jgi:3-deoxy-7-phosphoheptulonate synthase